MTPRGPEKQPPGVSRRERAGRRVAAVWVAWDGRRGRRPGRVAGWRRSGRLGTEAWRSSSWSGRRSPLGAWPSGR